MEDKMIKRNHGFSVDDVSQTTINIYPRPTVYVDNEDDFDNPKLDEVWEWAVRWTERTKARFPLCSFSVGTGIHDADYRVYAEVKISAPNGSHKDAAEWLTWETE